MTGPGLTYRIVWLPGTDDLLGQCHCGAEQIAQDPLQAWDWLLAHPEGHERVAAAPPSHRTPVAAGRS